MRSNRGGPFTLAFAVLFLACGGDTPGDTPVEPIEPIPSGPPDLSVEAIEASGSSVTRDGFLGLLFQVWNLGGGVGPASVVRFYVSSDPEISADDTEIGRVVTNPLEPLSGYDEYFRPTIPQDLGTHYFGACIDPVPGESNTENNCSTSIAVDIILPVPRGAVVGRDEESLTIQLSGRDQTRFELHRSSDNIAYALVNDGIAALDPPTILVDRGLRPNAVYYYKAKACEDQHCSEFSDPWGGLTEVSGDVEIPPTPTDFRGEKVVISGDNDDARVTWAPVPRATYYQIYQGTRLDAEVSAPHTSYYDGSPNEWIFGFLTTHYHMRACNKAGCSEPSEEVVVR